jgi:AraC-like DNA-binding protein
VYVREGRMNVLLNGQQLEARAGDFCLFQPGDVHTLWAEAETMTPFAHFDIFYNPAREDSFPTKPGQVNLDSYEHLLQPRLETIGVRVPVRFQPQQPTRFRDVLTRLITLYQTREPWAALEVQHLMTELVLTLCREFGTGNAKLEPGIKPMAWVASYLAMHISDPISVPDMARQAHLSPSRFAAVFREHFGESPHAYLLQMRIDHAKELLRTTRVSVAQIAGYCGFADAQHFAKAFKNAVGVTPSVYRVAAANELFENTR